MTRQSHFRVYNQEKRKHMSTPKLAHRYPQQHNSQSQVVGTEMSISRLNLIYPEDRMEYVLPDNKKNEDVLCVTMWMNLKASSQIQKATHCVIKFISNVQSRQEVGHYLPGAGRKVNGNDCQ